MHIGLTLGLTGVSAPSLVTQAIAAIRRNNGTLLLPGASTPVLGDELSPDSSATLVGEATRVSAGVYRIYTSAGALASVDWNGPLVIGKTYLAEFTIDSIATLGAGVSIDQNGVALATYTTTGRKSFIFTATIQNARIKRQSGATDIQISDVTTKEVLSYTHGNPTLRNYLDSAGTDLLDSVTQVDQPVGLALDSMGATTQLFSASNVTGTAGSGAAIPGLSMSIAVVAGRGYRITYTITSCTGQASAGLAYQVNGTAQAVNWTGTFSEVIFATATATVDVGLMSRGGFTTTLTGSVVVEEIPGNHATQATTASKPILRRGLVNQLLWSGDFTNAAWFKAGATFGSSASDPIGGTSAVTTAFASGGIVRGAVTWPSAVTSTFAVWARKSASGGANAIRLTTNNTTAWNTGLSQKFTLTTEWQLCALSGVLTSSGASLYAIVGGVDASNTNDPDCVGNVDIYRAALFQGTLTAQQIIDAGGIPLTTTAPASSSMGNYQWQFDGSNDFLQTGITTGNEGWVCAGVTQNAAANVCVAGNGATGASAGVAMLVRSTGALWGNKSNGSTEVTTTIASAGSVVAGVPFVYAFGWNATTNIGSFNNTEVTQGAAISATSANVLKIGEKGNSTEYFNGSMSATVYTPVLPSAADRALIRRFVATLNGQLVGYGPERVVNGDFSNGTTGWTANGSGNVTFSNVSNALRVVRTTGTAGHPLQVLTLEIGKTYLFSVDRDTSVSTAPRLGLTIGSSEYLDGSAIGTGRYTKVFTATHATAYVAVWPTGESATVIVDNISVREVGIL